MFMSMRKEVRLNKETIRIIKELRKKYPDDYPNDSAVLRSGVYVLKRWRELKVIV